MQALTMQEPEAMARVAALHDSAATLTARVAVLNCEVESKEAVLREIEPKLTKWRSVLAQG